MPVPAGTICEVQMFNGVIHQMVAGTGTFDIDGSIIPVERSAGWSAWDYSDGGPMEPKFRLYRVLAEPMQEQIALPKSEGRPFPKWFANPERMDMDFQSIKFAAEERCKRDPALEYAKAIKAVIADCLAKNDDPGHVPTGAFMDWNWFRLDRYKEARGESVGVPVREILRRQMPRKIAA